MQLPFRFGEYFPSVIQIREIAFSQVGWPGSKRLLRNGGLSHAFESQTQGIVDNLFKSRISFIFSLLEKSCDIVIQTQSGSHPSKHIINDALMPSWS